MGWDHGKKTPAEVGAFRQLAEQNTTEALQKMLDGADGSEVPEYLAVVRELVEQRAAAVKTGNEPR